MSKRINDDANQLWVKANETFVTQYEHWKSQPTTTYGEDIPNIHSPTNSIVKATVKHSTRLTEIPSSGGVLDNGTFKKKRSAFRLSGDIFTYMERLEQVNEELKNQLDTALGNLNDSEVVHKRVTLASRSMTESLQQQIKIANETLKNSDVQHHKVVCQFEKDIEEIRQQLSIANSQIEQLQHDKKKLLHNSNEIKQESREMEQSDYQLIQNLNEQIESLETLNAKLISQLSESEKRNQKQEQDLIILWTRINDLHSTLQSSKHIESLYEKQCQTIEELKIELEHARDITHMDTIDEQDFKPMSDMLHTNLFHTPEGWEW
ncbi:hypothetical protein BC833DRAFT_449485 [Globomyces pollinis-pini]|nr:hypothetical protein BC833DRAFT_449485 [Globomyces pollinis-pini]